jgi:hypothetical protein
VRGVMALAESDRGLALALVPGSARKAEQAQTVKWTLPRVAAWMFPGSSSKCWPSALKSDEAEILTARKVFPRVEFLSITQYVHFGLQ